MRIRILFPALLCAAFAAACGDDGNNVASDDGGPGGDSDGGPGGGDEDASPGGGGDGCPTYHDPCSGECVPVGTDPLNCGECGVECTGDEACVAGECSTECLSLNEEICDNRCVDTKSDSAHCGECGSPCDPGEGCVDGSCVAVVGDPGGGPGGCEGGGDPLDVGEGDDEVCAGDLAEVVFRWALCSCDEVDLQSPLTTGGFSSTMGGFDEDGLGGGVGLNGPFTATNEVTVQGDLWTSLASDPFSTSNPLLVLQELHAGGGVDSTGIATIGEDAFVDGDVAATNAWDIVQTLHVPTGAEVSDQVSYATLDDNEASVSVPDPCDFCNEDLLPIADFVAWSAEGANNDNNVIDLDPDVLVGVNSPTRLDLPCGVYHLSAVDATSPVVIAVHGRTALFVAGDFASTSTVTITVDSTAELDLFVGGTLNTTDKLKIGSPSYPARTRVYLGSVDAFTLTNNTEVGAFIYAAYGLVNVLNELTAYGGIYAGDFRNEDDVWLYYDREVLNAGDDCPEDGDGDGDPDPETCDSCLDCGNQACVEGECGACTDSSDCCAPLECFDGRCENDSSGVD